jgi:hypothetical protein
MSGSAVRERYVLVFPLEYPFRGCFPVGAQSRVESDTGIYGPYIFPSLYILGRLIAVCEG